MANRQTIGYLTNEAQIGAGVEQHATPSQVIKNLFNNNLLSDSKVLTSDGFLSKEFSTHKCILASNSNKFKCYFFPSDENIKKDIYIAKSHPRYMEMLLKYCYMHGIEFDSVDEAKHIYTLAKELEVKHLMSVANYHIIKRTLSVDSIFDNYNSALREEMFPSLEICRTFVARNTAQVLGHQDFANCFPEVLLDIVKIPKLNITSEFELISAVHTWVQHECTRRTQVVSDQNVRFYTGPFLPFLRFLTLNKNELNQVFNVYSMISTSDVFHITTASLSTAIPKEYPYYLNKVRTNRF